MRSATWSQVIDGLLSGGGEFRDRHVSFKGGPFVGEEPVFVTTEGDWKPEDAEVPTAARREGMTHCLDDAEIEDVIFNLMIQDPRATRSQVFEAIRYFVAYDAFIEL